MDRDQPEAVVRASSENRKSNSSSCFSSDDTDFLDVPKTVAAHSKRFKTSVELKIMEDNHHQNSHQSGSPQQKTTEITIESSAKNGANSACNNVKTTNNNNNKRTFVKSGQKLSSVSLGQKTRHQSPGAGSLGSESLSSRWSSSDEEASAYNDRSRFSKDSEFMHRNDDDDDDDNEDREREISSRDGLDDVEGIFTLRIQCSFGQCYLINVH